MANTKITVMEQHAVFAFLSVFLPLAYAFPAAVETSSSASRFNVGLSSSFNHLDVASQKIENQPTLVNSKLTSVSNQQLGALEALTNPVEKIGTSNPKLGLISHIQALALQPAALQQSFPDSGRKEAIQERESKLSMLDSLYSYAQNWVAGLFNQKPLIDTVQEHEKYGNDGDKHRAVGVAVVNSFEGLSNFLNSAVEVPFVIMKQLTQKASSALNNVGSKLVGLQ